MKEFAFEAGLFNEPSGTEFVAVFAFADGITFVDGDFGLLIIEVDIVEEGARAGFF